jgi:anti-anti-sigma regulatory factor
VPAPIRRSMNVALDEVLNNTISYGFAGRKGGEVTVEGLNETVREVFDISGFSTILAVFATAADALKGF